MHVAQQQLRERKAPHLDVMHMMEQIACSPWRQSSYGYSIYFSSPGAVTCAGVMAGNGCGPLLNVLSTEV